MNRNSAIDVAKVVCAILIYLLHANIAKHFGPVFQSILENGIFRIGVPFFFTVSGYYFFNNVETSSDLYNWCKTLLIIYLFWMMVYLPFYYKESLFTYIFGFWHLWYLMALLLAGVILYLIKDFKYTIPMVIAVAILGVVVQYVRSMVDLSNFVLEPVITNDFFSRNFLFFALPYVYIGWLINKHNLKTRVKKYTLVSLLFIGLFAVVLESALQPQLIVNANFSRDLLFSNIVFLPLLLVGCLSLKVTVNNSRLLRDFSTILFLVHPLAIIIANKLGSNEYRVIFQFGILLLIIPMAYIVKKYIKFVF
ncbi:acyltransferase family protein [Iodobacter fluviatilis]|uniref:Acyltransferase-like protein n=1 Tax=Iodobacter fluviatilis TaxID=537 RepID=A0A377Q3Y2_9NEIS|nr:acyltransferase family protein [Iodobacter fluviatilis]TCU81506.1 acyltransferase-like protein [Iodobacter fluviatilis]STQ89924.1 Serine/alanine racemase [Iodobacter fluviatilis]